MHDLKAAVVESTATVTVEVNQDCPVVSVVTMIAPAPTGLSVFLG